MRRTWRRVTTRTERLFYRWGIIGASLAFLAQHLAGSR